MADRLRAPVNLVRELIADLAVSSSGVGFVYRCLDVVAQVHGCTDAVLVIDGERYGRQAFRMDRRHLDDDVVPGGLLGAKPGLYTVPRDLAGEASEIVCALCTIALELDRSRHDARHDSLTGLLNRRSFDELLEQVSSQAARYGWPFALVLVDVDEFKAVNDTLGHAEGDRILQLVGRQLAAALRAGDRAARVGGDEFALVLANASRAGAARAVERLRASLAGLDTKISLSVGIAAAPDDGVDGRTLYALADGRLYEEKGPAA